MLFAIVSDVCTIHMLCTIPCTHYYIYHIYTHYVYTGKEHAYPWAHPYDEIKEVYIVYSI